SRGNADEGDGGAFGSASPLLPVPEGVDADAHRLSELDLGEPHEAAEGGDVGAGAELPAHQPAPQALGDDVFEVDRLELRVRVVGHRFTMYLRYASRSR